MKHRKLKVLMVASVASMIDQFNMPNICLLQSMGYEVHVVCNFKEGNTCDEKQIRKLQQKLTKQKVTWYQWDCPRHILAVQKCFTAYRQLMCLTQMKHYDWLHCHSPIGGALARIVAHKRSIRVIYTAHGFHFYKGAPLKNWILYYPAEKILSRWTDVLITVNDEDYKLAKRKLKAKETYKIPGVGIDMDRFCQSEKNQRISFCRKYKIPEHACIFLSVGELNKGKNHRMVIRALAAMQRQDLYYLICGQGALKMKLKRYAHRLGVSRYVRMPGFQKDMPEIYQNADVFVFPSKREGMPVALMEAMASGLPCVVSNIRGSRELADAKNGKCFSLNSIKQLSDMLEEFADHPWMRKVNGDFNRKKMSGYSQKVVQQKMKKIYEIL